MNIAFFVIRGHPKTFAEIAKLFEDENLLDQSNKYFFLTDEDHHCSNLEQYFSGHTAEFSAFNVFEHYNPKYNYLQHIDTYEDKYGIPSLRQYLIADQILPKLKEEEAFNVICYLMNTLEKYYVENEIDYFVTILPGGAFALACYHVAVQNGVKPLVIEMSRLKEGFLVREEYLRYGKKFHTTYQENLNSDKEFERAKEFCRQFLKEKYTPGYFDYSTNKNSFVKNNKSFVTKLRQVVKAFLFSFKTNFYTHERPLEILRDILKRRLCKVRMKLSSPFEPMPENEKFLFYPLHVQPEASINLLAPVFTDQIFLISLIAENLPFGYQLYVKEHPEMIAQRPRNYYQRIKRIKNVRLISPMVDGHTLVEKSKGVCVITGTVGWEAMIYQKPVIVFGNVFFDIAEGLCFKVKELNKFPEMIREVLYHFEPDEEKLYAFVDALLSVVYTGKFSPFTDKDQDVHSEENIRLLADALAKELQVGQE